MQTETILVSVPADIARLYHAATPEQREKASRQIVRTLQYALMSREEAVEEFERISREMGAYASEQGLTEEKLNELLQAEGQ